MVMHRGHYVLLYQLDYRVGELKAHDNAVFAESQQWMVLVPTCVSAAVVVARFTGSGPGASAGDPCAATQGSAILTHRAQH